MTRETPSYLLEHYNICMMRLEMYSGKSDGFWQLAIEQGNIANCAGAMFETDELCNSEMLYTKQSSRKNAECVGFPLEWVSQLQSYAQQGFFLVRCRGLLAFGTPWPLAELPAALLEAERLVKDFPLVYGDAMLFLLYLRDGPRLLEDSRYGRKLHNLTKRSSYNVTAGLHALFQGNAKDALDSLVIARKAMKRHKVGRSVVNYHLLEEISSTAIALCRFIILKEDERQESILLKEISARAFIPKALFRALLELRKGHEESAEALLQPILDADSLAEAGDMLAIALAVSLVPRCKSRLPLARKKIEQICKELGQHLPFFRELCNDALDRIDGKTPVHANRKLDLTALVPNMESWERDISSLRAVIVESFGGRKKHRMLWKVDFHYKTVIPAEQTLGLKVHGLQE